MDTAQALYEQIDKRLDKIELAIDVKLEPVMAYVISQKEKKAYWELIKSGGIAAIVGSITAWLISGGK